MTNKTATSVAETVNKGGCTCLYFILVVFLGSWTFNWCLYATIGRQIPWFFAFLCSLFTGGITVPAGIVMWILHSCGIPMPFFGK